MSYIIPFIILITLVVFIHEYGHYYFAKNMGLVSQIFQLDLEGTFGFNDKNGTRWKFCMIPLVDMLNFLEIEMYFSQAEQERNCKKI